MARPTDQATPVEVAEAVVLPVPETSAPLRALVTMLDKTN